MTVKWRNCREVEQEHKEDERQYAHTYHYAGTICLCKAFWNLPKSFRDGILLHEIGHLLAGPQGGESDANEAARDELGARIAYEDSPYGRRLERLTNMARAHLRRNPGPNDLPYDEWIPTHAVRFNSDGTVSLLDEAPAPNRGRRRNAKPNLIELINTYNEASDPGAYRSDAEHKIEAERARTALRLIRQNYIEGVDYKELSSGALWPISR